MKGMVFAVSCALALSTATASAQPSQEKLVLTTVPSVIPSRQTAPDSARPAGWLGGTAVGVTGRPEWDARAAGDLSSERNLGSGSSVPQPQGR